MLLLILQILERTEQPTQIVVRHLLPLSRLPALAALGGCFSLLCEILQRLRDPLQQILPSVRRVLLQLLDLLRHPLVLFREMIERLFQRRVHLFLRRRILLRGFREFLRSLREVPACEILRCVAGRFVFRQRVGKRLQLLRSRGLGTAQFPHQLLEQREFAERRLARVLSIGGLGAHLLGALAQALGDELQQPVLAFLREPISERTELVEPLRRVGDRRQLLRRPRIPFLVRANRIPPEQGEHRDWHGNPRQLARDAHRQQRRELPSARVARDFPECERLQFIGAALFREAQRGEKAIVRRACSIQRQRHALGAREFHEHDQQRCNRTENERPCEEDRNRRDIRAEAAAPPSHRREDDKQAKKENRRTHRAPQQVAQRHPPAQPAQDAEDFGGGIHRS